MLDLLDSLLALLAESGDGRPYAVATIVGATGSVPRALGTSMLVSPDGALTGSLSSGCIEGAVVEAAFEAIASGESSRRHFGYTDSDALAVGLTCGGSLEVLVQPVSTGERTPAAPMLTAGALAALAGRSPMAAAALIRRIDAGGGGVVVVSEPQNVQPESIITGLTAMLGESVAVQTAAAQLIPLLRAGWTGQLRLTTDSADCCGEPLTLFVESRLSAPRFLLFGANDFGAALLPVAQLLGYRVTLCDARPAFSGQPRFDRADEVVTSWPDRYLRTEAAAGRVDGRSVICVLTHDPKFEIPLLTAALDLDVAYLGAMGSRRSHAQRTEALLDAGVPPASLDRLHSPIGLDLGAVTPAEVAVSITAEILATRAGKRSVGPLRHGAGPIHGAGRGDDGPLPAASVHATAHH
ncbi:XdhC family protein [Arthrobacter sp. A5]|uniref:XdhC family protein n=1 Tax=Arthrobacter sp. A5 TaxID=576926 RepID=UPI003DA7EDBA